MNGNFAQGRGSLGEYEEGLQQAMLVQRQVLEAVRGDYPELVAAHKQAAADIQTELAGLYASQHKLDQVIPACLCVSMSVPVCLSLLICLCMSCLVLLVAFFLLSLHFHAAGRTCMSCTYLARLTC